MKSLKISSDIIKWSKNVAYIEKRFCGYDTYTYKKLLECLKILNDINEYKGPNTIMKRKIDIKPVIKPNSQAFMDIVSNIKRMKR